MAGIVLNSRVRAAAEGIEDNSFHFETQCCDYPRPLYTGQPKGTKKVEKRNCSSVYSGYSVVVIQMNPSLLFRLFGKFLSQILEEQTQLFVGFHCSIEHNG